MKSGMLIASTFLLAGASTNLSAIADPLFGPGLRAAGPSSNSIEAVPSELRPVLLGSLAKDAESAPWIRGAVGYAEQVVLPSDAVARKVFGWSVAISSDGTTAMVGAPNNSVDPGTVYVFNKIGGVWTETQELTPTDSVAADFFGVSVSISGNTALIGAAYADNGASSRAGSAYIFTQSGGTWTQAQKLIADDGLTFDEFGWSVAIDGETAIVGNNTCLAFTSSAPGAAYVFTNSGNVWTQTQKLNASDGAAFDCFGQNVAVSGASAIVSATGRAGGLAPAVYVFAESSGTWAEAGVLLPSDNGAGFASSLALMGATAVVGAPSGGAGEGLNWPGWVYVFNESGGVWTESQKLLPSNGDSCEITDPLEGQCTFGTSLALDGNSLIVGAKFSPTVGFGVGAAYVFSQTNGTWTEDAILTPSDGEYGDQFGWSVAIRGGTALVGGPYGPAELSDPQVYMGAAYFYSPASPAANIDPGSLTFTLPSDGNGTSTFAIGNSGNAELTWAIAEAPANAPQNRVDFASAHRLSDGEMPIVSSNIAGPRRAAHWSARAADGELSFLIDDGSYEGGVGWGSDDHSTEYAAIWLNRFTPPAGTGAFVVDSISMLWPQTPIDTLLGREVNLLAYYDADGDGDPANAVRLGSDYFVTIDSLDSFVDYTVNFSVPGDGDIYVGFESTYALGGTSPLLFPAAKDASNILNSRSWIAGMTSSDPDPDQLDNNEYLGTTIDFSLFGTWLIRATGVAAPVGSECSNPSDVAWLSATPTSGSVAAGESQEVTVTADATGLSPGSYSAVLCVTTNDPSNALIPIPVSLVVEVSDGIFQDGFEGTP